MIYRSIMIGLILGVLQILSIMEAKKIRPHDVKKYKSFEIISRGVNQFSAELYERVVSDEAINNTVFSPLSVWMALSMALNGAVGDTKSQLESALHLSPDPATQHLGIKTLIEKLNALRSNDLKVVNKIFYDSDLKMKNAYTTNLKKTYQSTAQDVDFSNVEIASNDINDWIKLSTKSHIKEIIKPDDLSEDTALIIINAVYFKGQWKVKFDKSATSLQPFHLENGQIVNVTMMHRQGEFKVGYLPDISAEFIELPYISENSNDDMSMVVILPNNNTDLRVVEQNMKDVEISRLLSGGITEVSLSLPKFKLESKINLGEPLVELGLDDIFSSSANFSNIIETPVKISKIVQKAVIEVNEEGSEASAATELEVENRFGDKFSPYIIEINRPFMVLIMTKNVAIFAARILNPTII